ncbi:MAG TPA: 5'-nucleotidase C-terminal domain-containing protein [Chitinophagaceae bacterium]|nr:5'-nucleotidase C-terminal domain-containing protein [Chitinophagaceae bacterium]
MRYRFFFPVFIVFFFSCHTVYHPGSVQYSGYAVSGAAIADTGFAAYLKPFRDSMDLTMSEVIGEASKRMDIKRPVSTLGNFMSDAFLTMAREKFDPGADISVMKFGGIRRPYLEAGPITRSMVFEIMPFDNLMVLVTINGDVLEKFLQEIAVEGAGVSGFTMKLADKKASSILVDGKPIDPAAEYTLVYSDYNYNNTAILKGSKIKMTNYLVRDAIEDYVKKMKQKGTPVGEQLENRLYVGN